MKDEAVVVISDEQVMLNSLRFTKSNLRNVYTLVSNKAALLNEIFLWGVGRHFVTTGIACNKNIIATDLEVSILSTTSTGINGTAAIIEEQKDRAKTFWNESNYDEEMKRKVHGNVMKHLNKGTVLPIFHTLCQPPDKRLFPPNTIVGKMDKNCTDVIHLSSEKVTAGKCAATKKVDGVISDDEEMSYLTAFFKTSTGNYVPNFKVEDSDFTWKFDKKYSEYVMSLVNKPSHMAGEDIEVTKLMHPISIDKLNGKNLITRRDRKSTRLNSSHVD